MIRCGRSGWMSYLPPGRPFPRSPACSEQPPAPVHWEALFLLSNGTSDSRKATFYLCPCGLQTQNHNSKMKANLQSRKNLFELLPLKRARSRPQQRLWWGHPVRARPPQQAQHCLEQPEVPSLPQREDTYPSRGKQAWGRLPGARPGHAPSCSWSCFPEDAVFTAFVSGVVGEGEVFMHPSQGTMLSDLPQDRWFMPVILESRLSWIFLFSNTVVIVVALKYLGQGWIHLFISTFCHNLISPWGWSMIREQNSHFTAWLSQKHNQRSPTILSWVFLYECSSHLFTLDLSLFL